MTTDLGMVDEDWQLVVGGTDLAQRVLAAMRLAFEAAADHDGGNPVYLVWAVVDAPEPEAVTDVVPAPSLDALQAYLYEEISELFGEAYPYEIVRYVMLETEEDGVRIIEEGSDPLASSTDPL